MLLSIVIPTHNRFDYLKQCLEALMFSIGKSSDYEITVIDDHSKSEVACANRELCSTKKVDYVYLEKNQGAAGARNRGIEKSRGEWIAFLDDDVCVEHNWYDVCQKSVSKLPAAIIGVEGMLKATGDGVWDKEVENLEGKAYLTCHIVYRKGILDHIGRFDGRFASRYPTCEDHELAVRALLWGDIVFNPQLRARHLPRKIRSAVYIRDSFHRIRTLLDAEFYFFQKHRDRYHLVRYSRSFWGTYLHIVCFHTLRSLKRRSIARLIRHPAQSMTLIFACLIEQLSALFLVSRYVLQYSTFFSRGKSMNIWFAANIPFGSGGGVARSMQGLAEGLQRLGHRTEIVVNASNTGGGYLVFALKLTLRLLSHIVNQPDWIIARSTDGIGCALLIKALALKTRVAVHNHGWEEYAYEFEKRLPVGLVFPRTTWKARIIRFPVLRACLALSSSCICGTISEIRWLKKKYPQHHQKFRYIANGVHVVDRGFWLDQNEIPLHILSIGSLTWKKNLNHTISVFKEMVRYLPQSRLFLIGTGLEKHQIQRQLIDEISVVPEVTPGEMSKWYMTCPYLISSSRYEGGHSFALLEAMSFACVVFASAISSSTEIIQNKCNGLLITGVDVKDDAAAISALLKEKERLVHMRRRAFCSAQRNRWERQVKRMERILCKSH